MNKVKKSLIDLVGREYIEAVIDAQVYLSGKNKSELIRIAGEEIEFYPDDFKMRQNELLKKVGRKVIQGLQVENTGAPTESFRKAQHNEMSGLASAGCIRLGEDGRIYFTGKSEHYHSSLGHNFPGYALIENAKKLGISNIAHNNTRGYITRLLEKELIRVANGIEKGNNSKLQEILSSEKTNVLNRVINLETGSLAVEAALKMMLARFYRLDKTYPSPKYSGKIPVFLVMGDNAGGKEANYHGTTVLTQTLRGMWPELYAKIDENNIYHVQATGINEVKSFQAAVEKYDSGRYKIAGFFHELVLMNYGGIKLTQEFVDETHKICRLHDIPIMVDEIQSCMWSPELFLFKEYGCTPDFVSVGKGFPGGQYPASKILTTPAMDSLNQFGALVTNGQEELASLSYLITIEFAESNSAHTREMGRYYHNEASKLVEKYPGLLDKVEGEAHMTCIYFHRGEDVEAFAKFLNKERCIDISAQTYKADCPPSALTKLPLISDRNTVDFLINELDNALKKMHSDKDRKK